MKLADLFRGGSKGRRTFVVVGLQAAVALTIGAGVVLASEAGGDRGITVRPTGPVPRATHVVAGARGKKVIVGYSYDNDTSAPLRELPAMPLMSGRETEASPNPRVVSQHQNARDTVRQTQLFAPNMPALEGMLEDAGFSRVDDLGLWRAHEIELARGMVVPGGPATSGCAVVLAWV